MDNSDLYRELDKLVDNMDETPKRKKIISTLKEISSAFFWATSEKKDTEDRLYYAKRALKLIKKAKRQMVFNGHLFSCYMKDSYSYNNKKYYGKENFKKILDEMEEKIKRIIYSLKHSKGSKSKSNSSENMQSEQNNSYNGRTRTTSYQETPTRTTRYTAPRGKDSMFSEDYAGYNGPVGPAHVQPVPREKDSMFSEDYAGYNGPVGPAHVQPIPRGRGSMFSEDYAGYNGPVGPAHVQPVPRGRDSMFSEDYAGYNGPVGPAHVQPAPRGKDSMFSDDYVGVQSPTVPTPMPTQPRRASMFSDDYPGYQGPESTLPSQQKNEPTPSKRKSEKKEIKDEAKEIKDEAKDSERNEKAKNLANSDVFGYDETVTDYTDPYDVAELDIKDYQHYYRLFLEGMKQIPTCPYNELETIMKDVKYNAAMAIACYVSSEEIFNSTGINFELLSNFYNKTYLIFCERIKKGQQEKFINYDVNVEEYTELRMNNLSNIYIKDYIENNYEEYDKATIEEQTKLSMQTFMMSYEQINYIYHMIIEKYEENGIEYDQNSLQENFIDVIYRRLLNSGEIPRDMPLSDELYIKIFVEYLSEEPTYNIGNNQNTSNM